MVDIILLTSRVSEAERQVYRNRLNEIARQSPLNARIEVSIHKNDASQLGHVSVRVTNMRDPIHSEDDFRRYQEMARHLCDALEESARQCFVTLRRK